MKQKQVVNQLFNMCMAKGQSDCPSIYHSFDHCQHARHLNLLNIIVTFSNNIKEVVPNFQNGFTG